MIHLHRVAWAFLLLGLLLCLTPVRANAPGRSLTFEQRVACQEAIERVYYRHQIGAKTSFEEAVPRRFLEKKVRSYLQQSAALEMFWQTPVTTQMLQAELERIARGTRFPDRLREIYLALGNDPFVVRECFALRVLADRLSRNLFAFDGGIHAGVREEAEELRALLAGGQLNLWRSHPRRTLLEIRREAAEESVRPSSTNEALAPGKLRHRYVSGEEFTSVRSQAPEGIGEIGPVKEERSAFTLRAILDQRDDSYVIALYSVPKADWDSWWKQVAGLLDEEAVDRAAGASGALPRAWPGSPEGTFVSAESAAGGPGSSCPPPDTWDNGVLDDVPLPGGRPAVWTGNEMIVWRGDGSGTRYNPLTDTWALVSTVGAPSPGFGHTAVWTGDKMIVWGGGDFPTALDSGSRYDPQTNTWAPVSAMGAPPPRLDHTAIWTGAEMIVWGGQDFSADLDSGGRYDPGTDTWASVSMSGAPAGRTDHTAIWTGTEMIVWGGALLDTGGRYNPATDTWAATSTISAPSGRNFHTAVWTGSHMIVWGGLAVGPQDTGARYNPTNDTWLAASTANAPSPRYFHSAVWTGSRMLVWGGTRGGGTYFGDGSRYDPASDTWSEITTSGDPVARHNHAAVWTGDRMIVWGGFFLSGLNTGGRYDPVTDSWTPTTTGNPPARRNRHTAVWTGSVMIVWGGTATVNDGGRYDALVDSWLPLSTTNAPSARVDHTAVWTGNVMVVWGGNDSGGSTNEGGRYNPTIDSWAPTSTVNAPLGRTLHTAVWADNRMVVWGGLAGGVTPLDTGARYNPTNDTWLAASTANAPSPRYSHTAVWTGSRMLVWGGDGHVAGGSYEPGNDLWSPISTIGEQPRRNHTAIWTGTGMIIWGGFSGFPALNSGGIYYPATDSWTATSHADAPLGRVTHTAVWTGADMLVWGGGTDLVSSNVFGTGGRYDPGTDSWLPISLVSASTPRKRHTAVWADTHMIVWGGHDLSSLDNGGRYFDSTDSDQDGFSLCSGDYDDSDAEVFPAAPEICDGINNDCSDPLWPTPAPEEADADADSFLECTGDCDDADASTYPDAPEVNDGNDNQCPGEPGFGLIDEISGDSGFHNPADPGEFSWSPQGGANRYEVKRSPLPDFSTGCTGIVTSSTVWNDPEVPSLGGIFHYLTRADKPRAGSWGQDSAGVERANVCP